MAHVEQRERNTFVLVLDRADGRLGPQLMPSTLDCSPRPPGAAPLALSPDGPGPGDVRTRCGLAMSATSIASGGITMDRLVRSLTGLAGGQVTNRTGLDGAYALALSFSRPRGAAGPLDTVPLDEAPVFATALREQLGLRLKPEKTTVPVFVIDHIERPSEN